MTVFLEMDGHGYALSCIMYNNTNEMRRITGICILGWVVG